MNWLYTEFFPYCIQNGVDIQAEDKRHICISITKIPLNERKPAMARFFTAWQQGMHLAVCASQRQAMGRKYANKLLIDECKLWEY